VGAGLSEPEAVATGYHVKYANNPGKLAEWAAATHIERAPRRARPQPPDAGSPTPLAPSSL
jgi:hypothetical protein